MPLLSSVRLPGFLSLLLLLTLPTLPAATTAADVVSPEIAADRRVTFRLFAPKATEVSVTGQWDDNAPHPMAKDADGVWSVTVGPIEPDYWIYNFVVDGISIADPVNPQVKLRMRTSASLLDLPATPPAPWDIRADVPHGAVDIIWHNSKVTGDTRAYYVYTPPGYDASAAARYPVLYLIHGANGTAADWTAVGRANFMADNLLADGRMIPMIIVMPAGHTLPITGKAQPENGPRFERYLLEEVIPAVEKKYRVLADRDHRAIMGLSMGGAHALGCGLGHPEAFAWVGAFSSGPVADFATRFQPLFADAKATNARYRLLWIGCGRQDPAFARSAEYEAILTKSGITHTFFAMDGVHNYVVWRRCFLETAPLLFRP